MTSVVTLKRETYRTCSTRLGGALNEADDRHLDYARWQFPLRVSSGHSSSAGD